MDGYNSLRTEINSLGILHFLLANKKYTVCLCLYNFSGWVIETTLQCNPIFCLEHKLAGESRLGREGSSSEPSTSQTSVTANVPRQRMGGDIKVDEHRQLFVYSGRGKYSEKRGKGKATAKKQSGQTCTLKFVCLTNCNANKPPTSVKERAALSNAELRDTTITFDVHGDSYYCHEKILETFPKLRESGYNLMLYDRTGREIFILHSKPSVFASKVERSGWAM